MVKNGRHPVIEKDPWDSTVFISKYQKSSSRRVVCKLCGDVLTGGVTRLKAHYTWISSKGKDSCKTVTEELWIAHGGERARYVTIMGQLQGPIGDDSLLAIVQGERAKLPSQRSLPMSTTLPSTAGASNNPRAHVPSMEASITASMEVPTQASNIDVSATPSASTTQQAPPPPCAVEEHVEASSRKRTRGTRPTLQEAWAPSLKKKAEIVEERFFYQCNIAFNAPRTGAYKRYVHAVSATAAAGAPITPAGSEALRTTRLTRQVDMVHDMLDGHRQSWALYGCNIIFDGWKDIRKRHLLNILVSCCTSTTFLRAIDVSTAVARITGMDELYHVCLLANFMIHNSLQILMDIKFAQSRLVKCKDGLRRMIVDEKCIDWADSTSPVACAIVDNVICNNDFWRDADALQAALLPIVCVLRLCDSEGSTMGLLYEFMDRLRRAICDCTVLSPDRVQEMLDIFETRWAWFRRPVHCVAHILHPAWRSDTHRSDRVLLSRWNAYVERVFRDNGAIQNLLEEDLLEYRGNRGNFSRLITKDADNRALPVSWWEKFGGFNPTLQSLALRVLSQEVSSSGAERLWSIMGDIHTKDRNRLNTPQLDKLAYVNANLRVLEKVRALEDVGAVSWLPRQLDHRVIKVDAADISSLQPHTAEDDAYDFIREDMMRFSRQTRSTTCRLRGVTNATIVSSQPSRGRGRARRRRGRVAGPFIVQRLTPTPSECESEDSDASDASQT
ncbi:hypothetical protein L7F22_026573 [Adiantum nelumboides]|nr:hypothetical protein [Adiantum nelumboides]